MSTDDDLSGGRRIGRGGTPAADPSEDELARHWTLSPEDLAEVAQCRGPDHRRRFALQLCMLRAYGCYLDDYRQAPLKIVSHLSRQLGLPPVLFLDRPGRAQTERAQALRVRRYLGLRQFDHTIAADLRDWLRQGAVEGRNAAELLARAEIKLREWRVMLPATSTLERLVVAEVTHATISLFETVANRLPASLRASVDLLLEVPEGDARSNLFRLKDYPRSAKAAAIKGDIVRLRLIEELLGADVELSDLDPRVVRQLGELGRRYDAGDLKRFAEPKRTALVACYLIEARKTLLDQIIEMNDLFLTAMNRKARNAVEKRRKAMRRRARDGLHRVLGGVDALAKADPEQTVGAFRDQVNAPALVQAADACRRFERLEERGHLDAMRSRYSTLRQYMPGFLMLPFQAAPGSETLLQAIDNLRALDAGARGPLTAGDPHGFVPADWRPYLVEGGKLDRPIWEISLAFAVRNALRAGGLFLPKSRDHVSFWRLVYDDRSWQASRAQAYQALGLPIDAQAFLGRLIASFEAAARAAADGLARNHFAAVRNGRLKWHSRQRQHTRHPRAHLGYTWLHRAPVRPVCPARHRLHAAAERPFGSGAELRRSRRGLWPATAAVAERHRHRDPHRAMGPARPSRRIAEGPDGARRCCHAAACQCARSRSSCQCPDPARPSGQDHSHSALYP
jgi:hypothetical protein